ncbi:MAG: hypothetical protein IPJ30_11510 [Acidobacteria bacterium]|nr:hypothetical protein [Acidobacteriota bacterium]
MGGHIRINPARFLAATIGLTRPPSGGNIDAEKKEIREIRAIRGDKLADQNDGFRP